MSQRSGEDNTDEGAQIATATPESGRGSQTAMQAVLPSSLPAGAVRLPARFARLRFIDREGTARKLLALEPGNGGFRRGAVRHLDEAKAFGAAGVAIGNDPDLVHSAIWLKELAKVMVCGGERQIANINIHGRFLVGNGANDRQVIRTGCRSKQMQEHDAGEAARIA